jgi:hypothetical protein
MLSEAAFPRTAISEAERHTHKMHILGKFCSKNLTSNLAAPQRDLLRMVMKYLAFPKKVWKKICFVTFDLGAAAPCPL